MKRFNDDLERELRLLGFDNFVDVKSKDDPADDFHFIKSRETIIPPAASCPLSIIFLFSAYDNERTRHADISSICAGVVRLGNEVDDGGLFILKSLHSGKGPLPSKNEMIEILKMEVSRLEQVEKVQEIIKAIKNPKVISMPDLRIRRR